MRSCVRKGRGDTGRAYDYPVEVLSSVGQGGVLDCACLHVASLIRERLTSVNVGRLGG